MANLSFFIIILAMLAIIVTVFLIHYRLESSFKNAMYLLVLFILTALFAVCLSEIVDWSKNEPSIISQNESNSTNNGYVKPGLNQEKEENSTSPQSIDGLLYSLTPMARKIVKERDKTFSPDWLLLLLTLLGSVFMVWAAMTESLLHGKSPIKTFLGAALGLLFSFIHFYTVFFVASFFSMLGKNKIMILRLIIAGAQYLTIFGMFMLITTGLMEIIDRFIVDLQVININIKL